MSEFHRAINAVLDGTLVFSLMALRNCLAPLHSISLHSPGDRELISLQAGLFISSQLALLDRVLILT